MVTTIKSAFDPLNDLSSLGLAGTYMIPNLSDISNKAMIAMSATSTGLNMLDKVGEHHAANPDQTLFQATYGTAKNFVKDAVTDKSFVKPREAVDHLVNVAKFGTELVTPLGLKAFTNPIESANDGVAAAFRTMAIAKSLKQAHQDTKQQTQQDSTLNYASTFKNVLPQYLKANKIGRAEALKMFGGGLKVVPGMHGGNDANLYNAGAVAMGTAASLANATIGKFAPVANFVQTGKDVVKGLEQGILKNAGIATNAIATLGDSVQSQIKQNMGISSPSKVMIALGLMITSGLAVGIKKGIVDVSGASKLLLKVFDFVTKKINLFNSQDISSYDDIIKNSADGTAQTTKNVYDEANKVNKRTFFGSLLGAGMVAIGSTGILGDKVSAPFKHLGAYYQGNIDVHKIQGRTAREAEMAVMYQSMAEFAKANKKKEWKNLWGMAQKQTEMISDDWSVTSGVVGTSVAQIPEFKTLYKTLGGFNYGQNKEGGLQINDVYDWNAGEKKATKFKTPFGVAKKVNDFLIKHPKMAEKLGFTYNPKYKGYGINTKKAPLFAFLGDPDDPTLSNGNDIILGDAIHSVIGGKAYIQSHTTSQEKLRELQKKARTAFNRVQGNPVRFAEQPEIQSYLEGLDFGDAPSYNLLNLFGVNDVLNRRTAKNNLTKEKIESFKKSGAFPYEENIKHGKGLLEEFEKDKASNPLYSVAKFANKKGLNDYLLMSMHEQAGIENKLKLQKEIFKELSGRMPVSYENPVINHKSFFDNIKQMRKDGLSYKDIGTNLVSAFGEGILTSSGTAIKIVINFAKNILNAIKEAFNITLPNRQKTNTAKGLGLGLGLNETVKMDGENNADAPSNYSHFDLFGTNHILNKRKTADNLIKEKIESLRDSGAFSSKKNIERGKSLLRDFDNNKVSRGKLYSLPYFILSKRLDFDSLMAMQEQAGIQNRTGVQKGIFKFLSRNLPDSYVEPTINHKSFFDNIKQMRKDGLSYKDIGRNVISAFSEGVLTSAGSALATVIIFAKNILSAIKKVFRIASPSGEGIDVGKNFASSTGVGIDNGSDKAVESAKTLAEKLKATLREEFKSQILSEENLQINPARVLSQQMERFDGYVSGITPEEIRKKYAELQKRNISGISHDYVFKYAANDLEELLDPTNKSDATIKRDKKKADYIQKTLNNVFDKFDDWDSKWGDAFVQTDDGVKSKQEYLKSKYPYTYQKDGFIRENSFVGINDVLNRRTAKNAFLKERIEMKSEYFNTPSSIKEGQRLLRKYEKIKSRYPFYSLEKFAEEEGLYPHRLIPMHEQAKRANKPKLQKEILDYTGTYYEDVKPINPKGFFDNIKQMRKDGLGYKDIGINLISALKEGVLLSVPHVLRTINIFAKSVIATVKNIFKIASPSQVFIEIGKNIISSIGTGIKNFAPIALKATQDIAGGIFKTLLNFSKGKVFKNIGTSFFNGGVLKNLISSFFAGGALKDVGIGLISSMFKGGALKDVGIEFISSMFMGGGLPNIAIGLVSSLFAGGIFKNVAIDSIFKGGGIFKNIGVGLISSIFKGGSLQDISIQLISSFFKGGSLKDVGIGLVSAIFKSTNLQDISSNFFSSIFKGGGLQNISSNFFSSIFKDGILKNISSSFKKLLSGYAPVPDSQSTPQNPQGSITLADQYLNAGNTLVTNVFEAVKSSIRQSTLSGYASLGQVMRNAVNAALFSLSNTLKQPLHQALLSQARSILPWFLQFIPASFQLLPKLSFAMPFVGGMALRFGNSIIKNLLENNILKEGGFLTNLLSSITKINLPTLAGTKTAGVAGFLSKIVAPLPFIAGSHPLLGLGINAVSPVYDAFSGILGLDNSMKPNLKKQALSAKEVFENQTKINRKKAQLQDFKGVDASKELVENLGNTLLNSVLNNLDIPVIPKSVIQRMIGRKMGERSGTIADVINAFGIEKSKAEQVLTRNLESGNTKRLDGLTKQILRERGVTKSARDAMTPEQLAAARDSVLNNPLDITKKERDFLRFEGDLEANIGKKGFDITQRTREAKLIRIL
ncbi:MAG: hypothetical protein ACK55Q_12885, partial [Dolichospermum sp.]